MTDVNFRDSDSKLRPAEEMIALCSARDRLFVPDLPAPSAGAVAALQYALLVDLRDDLAVAGEQRSGSGRADGRSLNRAGSRLHDGRQF
jgi:hypothetical protein